MKRLLAAVLILLLLPMSARAQSIRFTLDAHDVELADVILLLGAESGRNVIADGSLKPLRVTLRLHAVDFDEALAAIGAQSSSQQSNSHRRCLAKIPGSSRPPR